MALLKFKLKQQDPELELVYKKRPPVRVKIFLIKRHHRQRLVELFQKSIEQIPQLDYPTEEQDELVRRRMSAPTRTWQVWHAGKESWL